MALDGATSSCQLKRLSWSLGLASILLPQHHGLLQWPVVGRSRGTTSSGCNGELMVVYMGESSAASVGPPSSGRRSGMPDAGDLSRGVWHHRIRCKSARGRTDFLVLHCQNHHHLWVGKLCSFCKSQVFTCSILLSTLVTLGAPTLGHRDVYSVQLISRAMW